MMDTLSIFELLSLPSGAQLVSDHGGITLLIVNHDGPHKVTIERFTLGSPISLLDVIQIAQQHGVELFTPTITVLAQQPQEEAVKEPPRAGFGKGYKFRTVDCSQCGKAVSVSQIKRHEATHDRESQIAASAPQEPEEQPEPEPEPDPILMGTNPRLASNQTQPCVGCGVLFGPTHVEKQPYEIVNGQPRCQTCATGSVYAGSIYGRRAA